MLALVLILSALGACGGGGGGGSPAVAAPHTWIATNSMLTARWGHTATLLPNGEVLVAGGSPDDNSPALASAELYNPTTGTWTETGSMRAVRSMHTATLLPNGEVLVAGGSPNNVSELASAELYNPTTGTWTQTGSMNFGRFSHAAVLLPNGDVLVVGGFSSPPFPDAETYDPSTGTWTATAGLNPSTSIPIVLLPNEEVLAIGYPPELYEPSANLWSPTGAIPGADNYNGPFFTNLTVLDNGTALIAGGFGFEGGVNGAYPPIPTAYVYQPSTGTWATTGNMTAARDSAVATRLQDGTVLAFGGNSDGSPSSELYDPSTGTWSATGNMVTARYTLFVTPATILPDGRVLVTGGVSSASTNTSALPNAELYTP